MLTTSRLSRCWPILLSIAALVMAAELRAAGLKVATEPSSGIVKVGQPVVWTIEWQGDTPPAALAYKLKRGGRTEIDHGQLALVDGRAQLKASLSSPGSLLAIFTAQAAGGDEHLARGGALVAPSSILPSAKRPGDFDAFWQAKIAEILAVPFNAQLEKGDSGRDDVDYWKITLNGYRGTTIRGQLARPAINAARPEERLPALFIPQWAGVYPLEKAWVTDRASQGWLVLNILAHDLPIDEPAKFYDEQAAGALRDYWTIGNDDRDTSYFLRMYLSCYQAIEYLRSRPDWNGKTLVVAGASQGGQQTLVAAALHPHVTAAVAIVPAGCDMFGPKLGRAPGWPQWFDCTAGKDEARVRETSRYYDVVNFASRIHCPVLVGYGLIDETCPPEGITAALNSIRSPKEAIVLPQGEHMEIDGSHQAYYQRLNEAWLPALREGQSVPPADAKR